MKKIVAGEFLKKFSENKEKVGLYALCGGFFLVLLDTTALNVALASMGKEFAGGLSSLQWVVSSYTLSFASFLLAAGALGDRFGAKRFYQWGLFLFTSMSFCSALAPTIAVLIGARVLQGVGAAIMLPSSLALLNYTFRNPEKRAWAISFWASIVSLGFASGPVLGGILVSACGWRSIFWINVPLGVFTFFLNHYFTQETSFLEPRKIDWKGHLSFAATLFFLSYAFIETGVLGWKSPLVFLALVVAVGCSFLFYLVEKRSAFPVLPKVLFSNRTFSICVTIGAALNFSMYGIFFVESLYLQNIRHYTALEGGLMILPFTLLPTITTRLMASANGPKVIRFRLIVGHIVAAVGAFFFILALWKGELPFTLLGFACLGVGMGALMPAVTAGVMLSSAAEISGLASGILNCSRQVGGVLGVAIMGTCMNLFSIHGLAVALFLAVLLFSVMAFQSKKVVCMVEK